MSHLTVLLYIIQATTCMSFYVFFIIKTLQKKLRLEMKNTVICAVLYIIFSVVIIELFYEKISQFRQFSGIAGIIWVSVSIGLASLLFTVHPLQLAFIILVLFNINNNVMMIAKAIHMLDIFPKFFPTDDLNYLFTTLLMLFSITPLMWHLFIKVCKKVVELDLSPYYWRLLFIMPLTYFLFCWFSVEGTRMLDSAKPWRILGMLIFLNICTYLSYVAVLKMLIKTYESLKATEKANLAEQMLHMEREQYVALTKSIAKSSQIKHDFREHLIDIRKYLDCNDLDGLSHYLDDYLLENPEADVEDFCENHFVNIILQYYSALALENHINLKIKTEIPEVFPLVSTELCVLIGNLAENAIESCIRQRSGRKFVEIKARPQSEYLLTIVVTNSYDDVILCRGYEFLSNKHQGTGFGITSVRSITEKNGGSCKFSYSRNIFKAYALLVTKI